MKVNVVFCLVFGLTWHLVSADVFRFGNRRFYAQRPRRVRQLQRDAQGFVLQPEFSIQPNQEVQQQDQLIDLSSGQPEQLPVPQDPIDFEPDLNQQEEQPLEDNLDQSQVFESDQLLAQDPAQPFVQDPAQPLVQDPAQPLVQDPAQPLVQDPAQPLSVVPVEVPPAEFPDLPLDNAPALPLVETPVEAVVEADAQPVEQVSLQPEDAFEIPLEDPEAFGTRILSGDQEESPQPELPIQPVQELEPVEQFEFRQENLDPIKAGVDFSTCVIEPDTGLCCVETLESVNSLQKEPFLECTHKNVEKCHYTYVTQFEPSQEEVCEENFEKSCQITFKQQAFNETVKKCYRPLEKICDGQGPEQCRTVYESSCTTKYVEKQPGKFVGETSCEKLPIEVCGAGCSTVEGPEECHDKTLTSLIDVPEEVCDLNPQKTCRFQTRLVPRLKPEPECTIIPKETCNLRFTNPQQIAKPLKTKWCLDSTPPTPDNTYDESNARGLPIASDSQPVPTFQFQPVENIQRTLGEVVFSDSPFTAPTSYAYYKRS